MGLRSHTVDVLVDCKCIKWKAVADTFFAPKLTRYIRVQLVAFRNVGGDNDAYFDDISLSASSSPSNILLVGMVLAILAIVTGATIYIRKKRKK